MTWTIKFEQEFDDEFEAMSAGWQDTLLAHLGVLEKIGPQLGRPLVDTLQDSAHPNMKELRFKHDGGVWRVAFAFDPERKGIVLVAGDKRGADQKKFYKQLIATADRRFTNHLNNPPSNEDNSHDHATGETQ
jgi:hypothetical protein